MVLSIYKLKFHSRKTLNNVLFHAIEFVIIRVLTNANNDTAPNIFATTLCVFPYTSIHRRHRNRYLLLLGMLFFNQPSEQRIRFFACFPARKQIKVRREYQLAGRTGFGFNFAMRNLSRRRHIYISSVLGIIIIHERVQ